MLLFLCYAESYNEVYDYVYLIVRFVLSAKIVNYVDGNIYIVKSFCISVI